MLRSRWRVVARYREFEKAGERRVRIGFVLRAVVRVVVGADEAMRTAILYFGVRLLIDVCRRFES